MSSRTRPPLRCTSSQFLRAFQSLGSPSRAAHSLGRSRERHRTVVVRPPALCSAQQPATTVSRRTRPGFVGVAEDSPELTTEIGHKYATYPIRNTAVGTDKVQLPGPLVQFIHGCNYLSNRTDYFPDVARLHLCDV